MSESLRRQTTGFKGLIFTVIILLAGTSGAAWSQTCSEFLRSSRNLPTYTLLDFRPAPSDHNNKRLCISSFPWPKSPEDGSYLTMYNSQDIREIRGKIRKLNLDYTRIKDLGAGLSGEGMIGAALATFPSDMTNAKYALRIMEGVEPAQAELFSTYLLVRKLVEEGDPSAALQEFTAAREDRSLRQAWRAQGSEIGKLDKGDEITYLRKSTLVGLLKVYELAAWKDRFSSDSQGNLALLLELESLPITSLVERFLSFVPINLCQLVKAVFPPKWDGSFVDFS